MNGLNEKGFYIMETLIVLLIVGILIGTGVFYIQRYQRGKSLDTAVRLLSLDLQWSQSRAMNTGSIHKVTFYETSSKYEILNQESSVKVERSLPNNVTFTSTLDSLKFLPQGKVEEDTVILFTQEGSKKVILNSLGETKITN